MSSQVLFDRVISVSLIREDRTRVVKESRVGLSALDTPEEVITIPFTSSGYKPAIHVSLEMLPQSIALQMTVTLTNASIVKNADIRTFKEMVIIMGYTGGQDDEAAYITEQFSGPIMASYIEKPSPDNTIVFEGIATGRTGVSTLNAAPYKMVFHGITMSIKEAFIRIAQKLNLNYDISHADPDYIQKEIEFTEGTYVADNGWAVLNWFQSILYNYSKQNRDPDYHGALSGDTGKLEVHIMYSEDKLYLLTSMMKLTPELKTDAIDLSMIKSASFAGPALTVKALYNPRLHPGDLFKMDPIYYRGGVSGQSGLLNIMDDSVFNPDDGYYRALTVDVSFSSVGPENEMTILALPQSQYSGDQEPNAVKAKVNEIISLEKKKLQQQGSPEEVLIELGNEKAPDPVDVPAKDMWSVNYNPTTTIDVTVGQGKYEGINYLSVLASIAWDSANSDRFYLSDEELTAPFNRYKPDGVPIYYFFPLIQVATYKAMKKPGGEKVYYIDIKNPDLIKQDKRVVIPSPMNATIARSFIRNSAIIQIMEETRQYYYNLGNEWYRVFDDIIYYLKNGRV